MKTLSYICLGILSLLLLAAIFAPLIAPHDIFNLSSIELRNANLPPAWLEGGSHTFLLGTDEQGRDLFSMILFGLRLSIFIAIVAVLISLVIGIVLGLLSGYVGGVWDSLIMRVVDVQLAIPSFLTALVIRGVLRVIVGDLITPTLSVAILIFAIAISTWVLYTRVSRVSVMIEKHKEYVKASQVLGFSSPRILFSHIFPNITGPLIVIATIDFSTCILIESTLSFLGVGLPPTIASLGTLIRTGGNYIFSGKWWVFFFPTLVLVCLIFCVNILADRAKQIFDPETQQ